MLTPVDVQNKNFKGGIGYDKKEVEAFMKELASDYGELYRSNVELKDKVATLNESLQHYRSIEYSMQKALTVSEKTAEETINEANDKARKIGIEAQNKADALLEDAKAELEETKNEIFKLQQQHKKFKEQFTKVLEAQLKIMDGEMVDIDLGSDFVPHASYSDGGFGGENSLGGGLGGGYVGNNNSGHEGTNQEPTIKHSTLNMDPFGDAMSGGGRFSRQTGKAFNGSSNNKSNNKDNKSGSKPSLNVKDSKPGANRVKKDFTKPANTVETTEEVVAAQEEKVVAKPEAAPVKAPTESVSKEKETKEVKTAKPEASVDTTVTKEENTQQTVANDKPNTIKRGNPNRKDDSKKGPTINDSIKAAIKSNPFNDLKVEEEPEKPVMNETVEESVAGEVEDKLNESTLLDSEDNHSEGFDFSLGDEESDNTDSSFDDVVVSGEVEDKINESTLLDSEDNYITEGFSFLDDDDDDSDMLESVELEQSFGFNSDPEFTTKSSAQIFNEAEDDTYAGEVEDKIDESTLIDSEDNHTDEGFNFIVGNEDEEEIPTIMNASASSGATLNIDPFKSGNSDDDGFNFL